METLGYGPDILIMDSLIAILFIALPLISLIHLARKKLPGTPLAIWALLICMVPVLGSAAYWIIRPSSEIKA